MTLKNFHSGHCACKNISFHLTSDPMFVNCCHCTWCQRETGSSYVINAVIETDRVILNSGTTEVIQTPSASGKGQKIHRCPTCKVALWSHYPGGGDKLAFVRVGTLENAYSISPHAHIFASTKHAWVLFSDDIPVFEGYYDRTTLWPKESLLRLETLFKSYSLVQSKIAFAFFNLLRFRKDFCQF